MSEENQKPEFWEMLKELQGMISWNITLKDESIRVFEPVNGYFSTLSLKACKMRVRERFKFASPATIQNLTQALLEDSDRLLDDLLFLESRKRVIGFLNGVFDLKTGQLRAYGSNDFILEPLPHRIPYKLADDIEPWFVNICAQWVGEETAEWFVDVLAYLLFIYPNEEQIWVDFFGLGANGKSVCEELLERILGDDKCIGCDLTHINRFSGDAFQHKWLVIGRDSGSFVSDKATSFIKSFSGESKLLVEEKGGSSYDVYNAGKLIVSTNTLIQSKDRTYSWYRRLFPIPFPYTFPRNEKFKQSLFKRLPHIIRFLLHRAYLYKANNIPLSKYVPKPVQDLIRETRYLNDRVAAFWEINFFEEFHTKEGIEFMVNRGKLHGLHGLSMTQVYERYSQWHESFFGETEKVEPSLRTFGGPYGAFLQSGAGHYFRYRKTMSTRVIELLPEYRGYE